MRTAGCVSGHCDAVPQMGRSVPSVPRVLTSALSMSPVDCHRPHLGSQSSEGLESPYQELVCCSEGTKAPLGYVLL